MDQQAYKFDSVTMEKIKKSFFITLAGIALTSGTFLGQEILNYFVSGSPLDWNTAIVMSLSAIGAWLANTLKEWIKDTSEEGPILSNK